MSETGELKTQDETPEERPEPVEEPAAKEPRSRPELLAWIGLLVVAIVLRFLDLGDRPFHHDESQDAYFSYTFFKDLGSYEYNPLLHGPVRFYLTAFLYWIFEPTNFVARLAPALMGVVAVGLPYLLRHRLGRVAAFAAGVMLAVGPSFLYFSRFAREDIYLAAITLLMIVLMFRFLDRPRTLTLCALGALVAVSFGIKESGGVLTAIGAAFFIPAAIVQGKDGQIVRAIRSVGFEGFLSAVATFVFIYVVIFTQGFTNFDCMTTAITDESGKVVEPARETSCVTAIYYGLEYWTHQQDVARGGDSALLYVSIIIGEEWPVLLLAIVGTVFAFRHPTTLRLFLVWFFVGVFAFHAYGSERFAWLVIHPLLPLVLLAGLGVQWIWQTRSRIGRPAGLALIAVGAVYLGIASFVANAKLRADPRNLLVSTQTSEQVRDIAEQVEELGDVTVTIDSAEGATFPYAWYFRDLEPGYIDGTTAGFVPDTQVLVLTENAYGILKPNLAAYDCRHFDFRVWWVKEYSRAFPLFAKEPKGVDAPFKLSSWWDWFTKREPYNLTGGMKQWFCVRRDVGPLPGKGTPSEIPTPPPAPPPA